MRFLAAGAVLALIFALFGCPQAGTPPDNGVSATIGISATTGPAPLTIVVTATDSTSTVGEITKTEWDFGGQASSSDVQATHTFSSPGRYSVKLTVTDSAGNVGADTVEVRVQGGPAVAVIETDRTSGPAPLTVQFDGRASTAEDDEILDYYWDFDDGSTSRRPAPLHIFLQGGEYLVTLRVVSGGGIEAQTETTITVDQTFSSLQFNGAQFAMLPGRADLQLDGLTFEAWFKAEQAGGTLAQIGNGDLAIEVVPAQASVRIGTGEDAFDFPAGEVAGAWMHLAVTFDLASDPDGNGNDNAAENSNDNAGDNENDNGSDGGSGAAGTFTVYVNGLPVGSVNAALGLTSTRVTLGSGFQGKIADVRLWSIARMAGDVSANWRRRLSGGEANLLGYWRINEGSGQTLRSAAAGGENGSLGSSLANEGADPAWSTDGPPL